MPKIRNGDGIVADLTLEFAHLLMRTFEELLQEAEFMNDVERRGVNGVATKVAQEILVLLQHDDIDAHTRQQKPQHHAGRSAAGDATGCLERAGIDLGIVHVLLIMPEGNLAAR